MTDIEIMKQLLEQQENITRIKMKLEIIEILHKSALNFEISLMKSTDLLSTGAQLFKDLSKAIEEIK